MSRNVTLAQLKADIQVQADIQGSATRHSPTLLTRLINQGIQRFREKLSSEGAQHFLTNSVGLLGPGATSPYPFYALDLSAASPAIVRTYAVDIDVAGRTKTLIHVPFADRTSFCGPLTTGEPVAWAHYQTAGVAIMPAPSQQYSYIVWHLPVLPDLVSDSDTFDGVAGWEDFITWDVVCKLIVRDKYPQAYQLAEDTKQQVWADVLRSATRVSSAGGAVVGRDSMGERMRAMGGSGRRTLPRP
jgi:hypothetical protein